MAENLDPKELVSFEGLIISNSIEAEVLVQLLFKKVFLPLKKFLKMLKEVQKNYNKPQN